MKSFCKDVVIDSCNFIVAFDLEWTKNYSLKNGNSPFCFSFVYFDPISSGNNFESLAFGFFTGYTESKDERHQLIESANTFLGALLNKKCVIVGHQLSSDIGVILAEEGANTKNFEILKDFWHCRKKATNNIISIFDTRYDLGSFIIGRSRRLVDICEELNMNVFQPELSSSMTKMQNNFYESRDIRILEKLSVLNIRHSLSSAVLYNRFSNGADAEEMVSINKIIYNNLRDTFDYVKSPEFVSII